MIAQKIQELLNSSKDPELDLDPVIDPLLSDPGLVRAVIEDYYNRTRNLEFNKLCVPAGMGLSFGSILAYRLNVPLIPLYLDLFGEQGDAEYLTEVGAINEGDKVLLHDDFLSDDTYLLARWIQQQGAEVVAALFVSGATNEEEELLKICGSLYVQAPV